MNRSEAGCGRGTVRRLAATLGGRGDRGNLLYVVAVGLAAPAAALVGVSVAETLGDGGVAAGGSGLAAGTLLFAATVAVFEAGWYAGSGEGD